MSAVRPGVPTLHEVADVPLDEVRAMLARCSERSLRGRFLGSGFAGEQLVRALTGTTSLRTLVARVGTVTVGIGSVDELAPYELAVLVEDRWQRRGVGRCLVTELAAAAAARDVDDLTVTMAVGNVGAWRLVLSVWPGAEFTSPESGVVEGFLALRGTNLGQRPLRQAALSEIVPGSERAR
ncbi:MAG: hypothetical protein QOF58_1927 [Pseudonocardiales bacterium]|jgi:GNAT superfamily N-acetyltransferase|nr:hypothetical protein [Pseudonocardiales bacterium]